LRESVYDNAKGILNIVREKAIKKLANKLRSNWSDKRQGAGYASSSTVPAENGKLNRCTGIEVLCSLVVSKCVVIQRK
jgi:hypothetical protein